jgi:hypothetical protein
VVPLPFGENGTFISPPKQQNAKQQNACANPQTWPGIYAGL